MPVCRNLSLPSSIEARKYIKRPDDLHALKHCFTMPCQMDLAAASTNDAATNLPFQKEESGNVADVEAHIPSTISDGHLQVSNSRETLSQPCLTKRTTVATRIFPHLFLGSQNDVADKTLLENHRITNVLNVSCNCSRPDNFDDDHFKRISIRDNHQEYITPHLDDAVKFIEAAREKNERVLVHCLAGVSRSATVAIAYVMYYLQLNFDEAYRFVKEKRTTISPNFNFLGQLMEYEKGLQQQGRMTKTPSNSAPAKHEPSTPAEPARYDDKPTVPKIQVSPPRAKGQVVNAISQSTASSTSSTSSFCRRRKGPTLAFNRCFSHNPEVSSGLDRQLYADKPLVQQGGAGVVLDLHVSVEHSRRLGSDGVEDDHNDDLRFKPSNEGYTKMEVMQKSSSLPRRVGNHRPQGLDVFVHRGNGVSTLAQSTSCEFIAGNSRYMPRVRSLQQIRSFTAPNSPAVKQEFAGSSNIESSDVEMTQSDESMSPPSPFGRFRSQTDPSPFISESNSPCELRRSPCSSPNVDKFVSRNTRSPKVLKKSFNLNLRPQYGYQAFLSSKQLSASSSFNAGRTRAHSDRFPVVRRCVSPSAEKLSSLTLSSPVATKDDPLLVVGKSCLRSNDAKLCSKPYASTSSKANNLTRGAPHAAKHILTNNNFKNADGTSEPFRLIASSDLKPRWRNRQRSSKVCDSAINISERSSSNTPSDVAPSSPTVMNHCNNGVGMISCS